MDPEQLDVQTTAKAIFIISSIGVVGFALWADSMNRSIEFLNKNEPKYDRGAVSEQIRWFTVLVIIFEFILFFSSSDVQKSFPILSQLSLIGSITLILLLQYPLQGKLSSPEQKSESLLPILGKTLMSWAMSTLIFTSLFFAAIGSVGWLSLKFQLSGQFQFVATLAGGLVGILAGFGVNFALSPYFIRKVLPTQNLEDTQLKDQMESCFSTYGLKSPSLYLVNLESIRIVSVVLAGLRSGIGPLRQSLFISKWAISALTPLELRSLVLNHISHILLNHSKKRIVRATLLISSATLVTLFLVFLLSLVFKETNALEILGTLSALASFVTILKFLTSQGKRHELEADLHCIQKLGVEFEHFSSALRKIDSAEYIDFQNPDKPVPRIIALPETERRIRLVEQNLPSFNKTLDSQSKAS